MFSLHFFKIKWWREYLCTRTFSVPKKQMFQIYLLRTHPRFSSATRPLYFSQSLHYPRGRDYSATPTSLRRERKLFWVVAAPPAIKRKMSYHLCPVCQTRRHGGRWRRQVAKPLTANSNSQRSLPRIAANFGAISLWIARSIFILLPHSSQATRFSRSLFVSVKSCFQFIML